MFVCVGTHVRVCVCTFLEAEADEGGLPQSLSIFYIEAKCLAEPGAHCLAHLAIQIAHSRNFLLPPLSCIRIIGRSLPPPHIESSHSPTTSFIYF